MVVGGKDQTGFGLSERGEGKSWRQQTQTTGCVRVGKETVVDDTVEGVRYDINWGEITTLACISEKAPAEDFICNGRVEKDYR